MSKTLGQNETCAEYYMQCLQLVATENSSPRNWAQLHKIRPQYAPLMLYIIQRRDHASSTMISRELP